MTRYAKYGRLDDPMREAGDTAFVGLNSREEPTRLQPGQVADAKNIRMEDGKATTRLGYTTELDLTGYFLATEGGLTRITKFGQVWYIGQAIEILRPSKSSAYQWATPLKTHG